MVTKKEVEVRVGLMKFIGISGLVCLVAAFGLAGQSYGSFARVRVIGNWENSSDGWTVHPGAAGGTAMQPYEGNATLGDYSLKVYVLPARQMAIVRDLSGDANLLADLGEAEKLQIDVTLKASEWTIGTGWVKPIEAIVIQNNTGVWQQIIPVISQENVLWNGLGDKTVTVTFDIPHQTTPDLNHASIIIITNYDGVEKAGNFYFDNIRLLGAAEPNQPAEPKRPAEPNKVPPMPPKK